MIDHHDSFVDTLVSYVRQCGGRVACIESDDVSAQHIQQWMNDGDCQGVIVSPGPRRPENCPHSCAAVRALTGRVPILGVCLGHQIIAHVHGARVQRIRPRHGVISSIQTSGFGLFAGIPRNFRVMRYHSLAVEETTMPSELRITARSDDGIIMGIEHRQYPVFGVQFHPEALLSEYGMEIIANFIDICTRERASFRAGVGE